MPSFDPKEIALKNLQRIPGVGKSIANDLWEIGITKVDDLKGRSPEQLYAKSNQHAGVIQDRCLLYVFRCAVYYASNSKHDEEKLKWWNWKEAAGAKAAGGRGRGRRQEGERQEAGRSSMRGIRKAG